MIGCDKCGRRAVVRQNYSGASLCQEHFDQDLHRKIREVLRLTRPFSWGARIVVALGGDRASSCLLHSLKAIFEGREDLEITALLVDEGIEGYRPEALDCAWRVVDMLDVPWMMLSFRDAFGIDVDDVGPKDRCTFCRAGRDAIFNRAAVDLRARALATGETLDDESQAAFSICLKGEPDQIERLRRSPCFGIAPRIKPLSRVLAREVGLYARIHGLPGMKNRCPYARDLQAEKALSGFEARHPGTRYSLLRSMERLAEMLGPMKGCKKISEKDYENSHEKSQKKNGPDKDFQSKAFKEKGKQCKDGPR
jgi:tRNA(Ile)-lysidine synthase TilS/MesJ